MEKNYIKPQIKVREIDFESALLDNSPTTPSLDPDNPSSGLPIDTPTSGGTATGGSAGDAGSKFNAWTNWESEDEGIE